jgi:CMP-N,N'-diacetyllegionaminic acid synthase
MYQEKKILVVIPARGGSKGLPGKNIKIMHGNPLITWSIKAAQSSKSVDRVFVSTDSEEIANVARSYDVEVPFLRPTSFAEDSSPSWAAVLHALDTFSEQGEQFDYVAMIEPTSPLRKENDIENAIQMLIESQESESLVSVGEVHMEHPIIVKKIDERGRVKSYIDGAKSIYQRQQADMAYFPYGVVYLSKVASYYKNKDFYTDKTIPYYIERWQNYEIDDLLDFNLIEQIILLKEKEYGRPFMAF